MSQALIVHGLAKGCSLGANFLTLSKASPADPAIEPQEFSSLLASYKLKGITKVRMRIPPTVLIPPLNLCRPSHQADLSVIVSFFRDAQSGLVHLAAVKKEFQLDIKPLPILSKTVRAISCSNVVRFLERCFELMMCHSGQECSHLVLQRMHLQQSKVCRAQSPNLSCCAH